MRSSLVRAAGTPSKASLLLTVAAAFLLSACSGSVDRFADYFSSSASSSAPDTLYTASVPKEVQRAGEDPGDAKRTSVASSDDRDRVSRRPLATNNNKAGQNYASNGFNYQQTYKPVYKQPTFQPKTYQSAETQPSVNDQPNVEERSGTVRVKPGMTLYSIARANQLSVGELAHANNLAAPYSVSVGQTLVIPGRTNAVAPQPAYARPDSTLAAGGGLHTVRAGETLYSLGRTYGVHPFTIARLNGLSNNEALRQGQTLRIPKNASSAAPVVAARQPEHTAPAVSNNIPGGVDHETGDQPQRDVATAAPTPVEQPQPQAADNQQPAQEAGSLSFRWPVKGRVISGYGSKPGGLRNEGINIAVPEGTDVRSAEAGVVAYAGNELKGYGNLVLIRHEGGWVTAYAHNKDLFVKRGDTVKRGDVIAKAGQTGSVSSPQVHFEVRKGATAMDPMRFLNASTAAN
jgi:murein DD-endopeptidase MepM/ murein hydrolase activator NlpD